MGNDFRYKMEHIGDCFAGMIEKVSGKVSEKVSGFGCSSGQECNGGKDLRYKVQHGGDYFVGMIEKVADSAKSSARGVILTYDINQTEKKEEKLLKQIGEHAAHICKENPSFAQDEKLKALLEKFDALEDKKSLFVAERDKLLYPEKKAAEPVMAHMLETA
ncbi:MAG: hypothetical protein HQL10_05595 [Nitrospirae bacterium]|uniref:Magnetosome protein Mad10 n=1 Tax=uncultured Nitrospirota bacterium TaxID=170969 RepID=A0A142BTU7_9BACT|nr:magnetosome protein Mad10 [uncultured Nitrospirota bacterium]MBF0328610.1 hypothetical protein [Nitrospirota bacterium]